LGDKKKFARKWKRSFKKRANPLRKILLPVFDKWVYNLHRMSNYKYDVYQPLPWIGLASRKRQESTLKRWEFMEPLVPDELGSAIDIGCNLGFFALKLAEKGHFAFGVDRSEDCIAIAQYAQRKTGMNNCSFAMFSATAESVRTLPVVDVTVFFSVWHHWIREFGMETATEMGAEVWRKTNKIMFFESGEDHELESLGVTEEPATWVEKQLELWCSGAEIKRIGKTGRGTHHRGDEKPRTLFAVMRKTS